jgi:hypothetical protein
MNIEIQSISLQHLDEVYTLFTAEFNTLPVGTLNLKSYETFEEILSSPDGVNIGVFAESKLVGYTLCEVRPWSSPPDPFALRAWLSPGEAVGEALGTLIDKAFQGRSLGIRMLRARRTGLVENGVRHATGMMLVDNFSSIITYLRSGAILCGFDRDDYDLLCFSHYSGDLADRLPGKTQIQVSKIDELHELFGDGYVCRDITFDEVNGLQKPVYSVSDEFVGRT